MLQDIERIKRDVAKKWGFTVIDLEGAGRTKTLSYARQEAMYRVRKETLCSYPEIGFFFGRRDHTTVIYACRNYIKIQKKLEKLKT